MKAIAEFTREERVKIGKVYYDYIREEITDGNAILDELEQYFDTDDIYHDLFITVNYEDATLFLTDTYNETEYTLDIDYEIVDKKDDFDSIEIEGIRLIKTKIYHFDPENSEWNS